MAIDGAHAIQEDILKNESSIINASEKEVNVKMDVEGNSVNISNLEGIMGEILSNQDAEINTEMEANVIENNEESQPEMTEEEQQLSLDLEFDLSDQYDYITEQYDELIKENANKLILMQNNLFPLSSMIEEYNSRLAKDSKLSSEENQKEFVDDIRRCLLK